MTHFSVAVFHKKDQSVDELLEPYEEVIEIKPNCDEKVKKRAIRFARLYYSDCDLATDEECWQRLLDRNKPDNNGTIYIPNPDGKWDYWKVGSQCSNKLRVNGKNVDSASVKDINFLLDEKAYADALDDWDVLVDGKPEKPGKEYDCFYTRSYYLDEYGDRESYARRCALFHTFAVITPDGKWHAPGKIGWFGMTSASPEELREWDEQYIARFIDTADPEWQLTIVDCHI